MINRERAKLHPDEAQDLTAQLEALVRENQKLREFGDEFVWGEQNPDEYESELSRLKRERDELQAVLDSGRDSRWPECMMPLLGIARYEDEYGDKETSKAIMVAYHFAEALLSERDELQRLSDEQSTLLANHERLFRALVNYKIAMPTEVKEAIAKAREVLG